MNEEIKPQEEKAQGQEEKAPAQATGAEKKEVAKKKINRLSLKEIEKRLEQVQEKMGSLNSSYARQLLKRKELLLAGQRPEGGKLDNAE